VIVGAWALAFHGRPRYTGDIDIFVARDSDNADRLMAVIEAFGFGQSGIERDDFLQVDRVIQLGRAPNRIDILTGISGVTFDEARESREQGSISGVAVFVISRDLLIKNKRAANRWKKPGRHVPNPRVSSQRLKSLAVVSRIPATDRLHLRDTAPVLAPTF